MFRQLCGDDKNPGLGTIQRLDLNFGKNDLAPGFSQLSIGNRLEHVPGRRRLLFLSCEDLILGD